MTDDRCLDEDAEGFEKHFDDADDEAAIEDNLCELGLVSPIPLLLPPLDSDDDDDKAEDIDSIDKVHKADRVSLIL